MSLRFLLLVLLLSPLAAWAQKQIRGIDSYARGNYSKAITDLSREVDNPRRTDKERARARLYLAASLYASGKTDQAGEQLKELARRHPDQRVDPNFFPPDFVAF